MPDKKMLRDFVETKTQSLKIMVVGDVMLDKYYYGEVTRISPEAPVPINRITVQKETLGGAANVAHNLALLGGVAVTALIHLWKKNTLLSVFAGTAAYMLLLQLI